MVKYESVLSLNNFNLISNTALEFRLKDIDDVFGSDLEFDLRELYLEWMTSIGDFSLGKQIITWGSASANNPTDVISPYNYFYLFSQGKEQKNGILSFNSNIYLNTTKLNLLLIPYHNSHFIPLNDTEFPISIPIEDPSTNKPLTITNEQIMELKEPFEYGISITYPFSSLDISASYFSGYDRVFSFFGANLWTGANSNPDAIKTDIVLSYRKTNMFGLGFSGIIDNFSLKGDFAYFQTDDNIDNILDSTLYRYWESGVQEITLQCKELNETSSWDPDFKEIDCNNDAKFNNSQVIDNSADYLQYTFELEYSPTYDFSIISQFSVSELLNIGQADSIITSRGTIMFDPLDFFIPGIGLSNTFISSNSLSISARKLFSDMGLELSYTSMFDLDKKGALHGAGLEYEILKNTNLLVEVTKIFNNDEIKPNPFTAMKDFSRILLEIRYFY